MAQSNPELLLLLVSYKGLFYFNVLIIAIKQCDNTNRLTLVAVSLNVRYELLQGFCRLRLTPCFEGLTAHLQVAHQYWAEVAPLTLNRAPEPVAGVRDGHYQVGGRYAYHHVCPDRSRARDLCLFRGPWPHLVCKYRLEEFQRWCTTSDVAHRRSRVVAGPLHIEIILRQD